jgi:hypothetical protein
MVFVAVSLAIVPLLAPSMALAAPAQRQMVLDLPEPGTLVQPTERYAPALLNGITVDPDNALKFEFIISKGDMSLEGQELIDESMKLIKYFLAGLTTPEENMWVNLSPYEKDRLIPSIFGRTEMGRDLLAQDYMLKQLSASLIYPEEALGQEFWRRAYQKAKEKYGTVDIPLNTFNKIWIVPDKAVIYEQGNSAYVFDSHLKVMLEEDYVALQQNLGVKQFGLDGLSGPVAETVNGVTSAVVREILIPEIEREVNEGRIFIQLRQIYHAIILASWYKDTLKESLLGKVYVNQEKVAGIDIEDKEVSRKIYNRYLEAFKKGVFNYIRADLDLDTHEIIPRKYFSGGSSFKELSRVKSKIASLREEETRQLADRLGETLIVSSALVETGDRANSEEVGRVETLSLALFGDIARDRVSSPIEKERAAVARMERARREYPERVAAQAAVELTALGLRGAYQRVKDILQRETSVKDKVLTLRYLFTELYSRTDKEELRAMIGMLSQKNGDNVRITTQDLNQMERAIKDTADALAKRIFERTVRENDIILMVRVSEGFGRDEVAESLKSNEVILPVAIKAEIDLVYNAIKENAEFYRARSGKLYPIVDAIIDVVEGTNQFVTNAEGKTLLDIPDYESGATSVIVTGLGVRDLGNAPDGYVGQFITNLGDEAAVAVFNQRVIRVREQGVEVEYSMKDPELYARYPGLIIEYLKFLAETRGQELSALREEILLMDRDRETQMLEALDEIKPAYRIEGLKVTTIPDGTVMHGLKAAMTREMYEAATGAPYGMHKTLLTIGGSAEGFMTLAVAGALKSVGAVGGLRVYSAQLNHKPSGEVMKDHSRRYAFTSQEVSDITSLRPEDAQQILSGKKLFTDEDVKGRILGAFSFISANGVFVQPGVEPAEEAVSVRVLSIVQDIEGPRVEMIMRSLTQKDMTVSSAIQAARNGITAELPLGGINLNPVALDLQIKRDGRGVPLPLAKQSVEEVDVSGFLPIILDVISGEDVLPARLGLVTASDVPVE